MPRRSSGVSSKRRNRSEAFLPPNNSLEPTRKRRAKMEAGLADVATTRSRGAVADEGPSG